jgi:hypothetical protein
VPIIETVEAKAAVGLFGKIAEWYNRDKIQKQQIAELKEALREAVTGRRAFDAWVDSLECRPEDDHMYFAKDGSGAMFCGVCIDHDRQRTPLTRVIGREGQFECVVHEHVFETKARREHRAAERPQPQPRYYGSRNSWMR